MLTSGEGQVLLERYQVIKTIGRGAGSEVYLVKDKWLDEEIVLKTVHVVPGNSLNDLKSRFLAEVRYARELSHPNVIRIFDFGRLDKEVFFISMEYCPTGSLQQMLEEEVGKQVEFSKIVAILLQVASGLYYSHSRSILHRDIKPANILLDGSPFRVKLCDFGCANSIEVPGGLTRTGCVIGTPEYMAPEQFDCGDLDSRTDIYGLGVLGFELAAGRLPFTGDSIPVLMAAHITKPVPRLSDFRSDTPSWFEEFIEVCLEKDPKHRFQSMLEVLAVLFPRCEFIETHELEVFLPTSLLRPSHTSKWGTGKFKALKEFFS